eukprot:SAG31_NODE_323_length_17713_cov_12.065834_8_plen_612_part_00
MPPALLSLMLARPLLRFITPLLAVGGEQAATGCGCHQIQRLKTLDEVAITASRSLHSTSTRHVRWYMASGAQAFKGFNDEWLDDPLKRAAITGVYACCNFWSMDSSGRLTIDSAGKYSERFEPFLRRGLTVHATGMLNEEAIKSGAALSAIPQLVEFVEQNLLDGVMTDYEPLDESLEHAQAYARFLAAAAAALHRIPGRRREIGLNIADWTILGPGYWPLYMRAGVDFMGSMTPTYSENARNWPYISNLVNISRQNNSPLSAIDIGVASPLQSSGPIGSLCRKAPFNSSIFNLRSFNWSFCNRTMAISDSCPWNETDLTAMLDFAAAIGVTHASIWRSDIDTECLDGTQSWFFGVLARFISGGRREQEKAQATSYSTQFVVPESQRGLKPSHLDPPAAGGECSNSCDPAKPGCPLTVPAAVCADIYATMTGTLSNLIGNGTAADPTGRGVIGRDLPSAALSLLMSQCPQPGGCCAPSMAACVQPPPPPVCDSAMALLRRLGDLPGTSFNAQAFPLIWHTFGPSCFAYGPDREWLLNVMNRSLPMTRAEATSQEVSYTNMYLMSTVNAILLGEIVGGDRGTTAARVGYKMWDEWRSFTAATGGIHEFTSPT